MKTTNILNFNFNLQEETWNLTSSSLISILHLNIKENNTLSQSTHYWNRSTILNETMKRRKHVKRFSYSLFFFVLVVFYSFSIFFHVFKIGITLIEVPYWWDGRKESLASTIHQVRSDILLSL